MTNLLLASAVIMSSFYNVPIERVIDGDTLVVTIPDVPDVMGLHRRIRVKGIQAAELHSKSKCERRDAVNGREAVEQMTTNRRIDLLFCEREKYDRLLCVIRVDEVLDISEPLLEEGLAVNYGGGKKPKWKCRR